MLWYSLVVAILACGCSSDDVDRLARVGRKAAAHAGALAGTPEDQLTTGWQAVRTSWDELALDARVAARIRWDKGLEDVSVQVRGSGGVVELRGTVPSLAQRRRAVELAETTVGVEKVVDEIQVPGM
jgi:osmotically-inducible protein OsmY